MIQEDLVYEIFEELDKHNLLKHIILIGGWCPAIYKYHF